jgi:osmotically-inducible protein OsmY
LHDRKGNPAGAEMRVLIAAILVLTLPACTSLLLGNASSGDGGVSTDQRSSSQVAADNTISATIRRRISADSTLSKYAIGIRTVDGNVTLSGTVGSFPARDRAVQIASDTDGVNRIRNQITVNTNL